MSDNATEWAWTVVYNTTEKYYDIRSVRAPHRAAAKQQVAKWYADSDEDITDWERCYVPRPTWDCPICGGNEAMRERPNCKTPPSWECLRCGTYGWGGPMEWDYLSEPSTQTGRRAGHRTPDGSIIDAPTEVHR